MVTQNQTPAKPLVSKSCYVSRKSIITQCVNVCNLEFQKLTAAKRKAARGSFTSGFPQSCLPERAAQDGRMRYLASVRIDGVPSIGSAMPP
nr:MAG TPA: hypothetical protein [Caudoviricetes sp.]